MISASDIVEQNLAYNTYRAVSQLEGSARFMSIRGTDISRVNTLLDNSDFMNIFATNWLSNFTLDASLAVLLRGLSVTVDQIRPPVIVFSTSQYTAIANLSHKNQAKRDTFIHGNDWSGLYRRGGEMFPCDSTDVWFPVFRPSHFVPALLSPTTETMHILDTLNGKHPKVQKVLTQW